MTMKLTLTIIFVLILAVHLGYGKPPIWPPDDDPRFYGLRVAPPRKTVSLRSQQIAWIKTSGKTAALAASAAREKLKSIPHFTRAAKYNIITTIKTGILVQANGLHALRAAQKARRLGNHRLAKVVTVHARRAIVAGKALLLRVKLALLKCLEKEADILSTFYGVDVPSLFGARRDTGLVLHAAELANQAAKAAHHAHRNSKVANIHAKNAAQVALKIAEDETE